VLFVFLFSFFDKLRAYDIRGEISDPNYVDTPIPPHPMPIYHKYINETNVNLKKQRRY
jgi:hypothetical protein